MASARFKAAILQSSKQPRSKRNPHLRARDAARDHAEVPQSEGPRSSFSKAFALVRNSGLVRRLPTASLKGGKKGRRKPKSEA